MCMTLRTCTLHRARLELRTHLTEPLIDPHCLVLIEQSTTYTRRRFVIGAKVNSDGVVYRRCTIIVQSNVFISL